MWWCDDKLLFQDSINWHILTADHGLITLFRIAWWPSAGKGLPLRLNHLCCFIANAVLIVCVPFLSDVLGRMCNLIVLVPDHWLCIYFKTYFKVIDRWNRHTAKDALAAILSSPLMISFSCFILFFQLASSRFSFHSPLKLVFFSL